MDKEKRNEEGAGRINPDQDQKDNDTTEISFIDQQEGNMNNGTIGGSFDDKKDDDLPSKEKEQ